MSGVILTDLFYNLLTIAIYQMHAHFQAVIICISYSKACCG